MSFVSSPPDVVSRLTDAYHQTVLNLGEISNTKISWHVTQHVLDYIWISSATSSTNANVTSSFVNNGQSSATATDEIIVHACQGCGYILHPGWKGTKLRVKRPDKDGKTIRRRKQRKRRKKAYAEETRAKDDYRNHHRRNSSSEPNRGNVAVNTNSSNKSIGVKTHHRRLVLMQNDVRFLARNYLVLTCGRCQDKIHLSGFRQEQQKKTILKATFIPSSSTTTATITKTGNLADNFEALPPSSTTSVRSVSHRKKKPFPPPAAATSTTNNRSSSSPSLSLLEKRREEQFGRKKKRKSKFDSISSDKKTGNLLNFLSSFNDH